MDTIYPVVILICGIVKFSWLLLPIPILIKDG
jgi:hypothetical protein